MMSEHSQHSAMKVRCPSCRNKLDVSGQAPLSLFPCPHCGAEFRVPQWYQSFLLEEIIHEESALHVCRALDTTLDREVRIKTLAGGERFTEAQLEAFLAVTRRAATIGHPQVAVVYACGRGDEAEAYAVQQFVHSLPYASVKERMSPILLQACGVSALHALLAADRIGVCHGGLSPGNFLIDEEFALWVTDFGVARALGKDPASDPYASPELRAGGEATRAGDIYSLGVLFYELATGQLPAASDGGAGDACLPLPENLGYSAAFSECLERMLARQPEKRPGNYAEILQVMEDMKRSLPLSGSERKSRGKDAATLLRAVPAAKAPGAAGPRRGSGRGARLINLLLLVAFVLLCALFLAFRLRQGRTMILPVAEKPSLSASQPTAEGGPAEPSHTAAATAAVSVSVPAASDSASLLSAAWPSRPLPADLDFKNTRAANRSYLETVPESLRERERERLRILGTAREHLQQTMRYVAYDRGETARIQLRDGRSFFGSIPRANERGLTLRLRESGKEDSVQSMQLRFEDLAWSQLWDIFAFYAEKRREMAPNKRRERAALVDVFDDYLRLALLCDWYGFPEDSRHYAGLAYAAQPGKEYLLQKYGLTRATPP
jgi:ribosomal protein S27E